MESCHIIVRLIQTPEGKNKDQRNAGLGERNVELKILNTDAMMSFRNRIDNSQPLELGNLELVAKQLLRMSLAFSSCFELSGAMVVANRSTWSLRECGLKPWTS